MQTAGVGWCSASVPACVFWGGCGCPCGRKGDPAAPVLCLALLIGQRSASALKWVATQALTLSLTQQLQHGMTAATASGWLYIAVTTWPQLATVNRQVMHALLRPYLLRACLPVGDAPVHRYQPAGVFRSLARFVGSSVILCGQLRPSNPPSAVCNAFLRGCEDCTCGGEQRLDPVHSAVSVPGCVLLHLGLQRFASDLEWACSCPVRTFRG